MVVSLYLAIVVKVVVVVVMVVVVVAESGAKAIPGQNLHPVVVVEPSPTGT